MCETRRRRTCIYYSDSLNGLAREGEGWQRYTHQLIVRYFKFVIWQNLKWHIKVIVIVFLMVTHSRLRTRSTFFVCFYYYIGAG